MGKRLGGFQKDYHPKARKVHISKILIMTLVVLGLMVTQYLLHPLVRI